MIVELHTPKGIIKIDSDTVTNSELAALKMTRADLNEMIPRDIPKELDDLKSKLKTRGVI